MLIHYVVWSRAILGTHPWNFTGHRVPGVLSRWWCAGDLRRKISPWEWWWRLWVIPWFPKVRDKGSLNLYGFVFEILHNFITSLYWKRIGLIILSQFFFLEDCQRKTVAYELSPVSNAWSRAVVGDGLQRGKWESTPFKRKGLLYLLQISPAWNNDNVWVNYNTTSKPTQPPPGSWLVDYIWCW